MEERFRVTSYLAGAIESASKNDMTNWREEVKNKLKSPDLLIYDPVEQESTKVGKPSSEQVKYIAGLKQGGHYDKFYNEMWKIYFGVIEKNTDIIQLLTMLRMRKFVDGNYLRDIKYFGDAEAVIRSDFIIVFLPKDIKTIGTIYEIVWAFLFRIPIYLILPDCSKTETNSSLLFGVMISGGEVFYSVNETCKFIKEKYKL